MGKFTDKFHELLKQNGLGDKAPDMANQPREFMVYNQNRRKRDRVLSLYRNAFFRAGFTTEQVYGVYKDIYGKEEADKTFDRLDKTDHWLDYIGEYLKDNRPDLLESLGEDREKFESDVSFMKEKVQEFIKDNKISPEEIDRVKASQVVSGSCTDAEKAGKLFEKLEEIANEKQLGFIEERVGNYQDIMERPEDWHEHPYEELCNKLKADAANIIRNDPEKLKKYIQVLDFASENLQVPNEEYKGEMWSRETMEGQGLNVPITNKCINENKATYKDGRYNEMFETKKLSGSEFRSVKMDRRDDFNELRNDKFHMSDKTREGMQKILKKMDEMELYKYSVSANGEDGNKTYAFCKIIQSKRELIAALEEKNPDPDKIIAAQEKYQKDWNDLQELHQIAKEYFSQDPTYFPGNMDSIRTDFLPIQFTEDLMTTAQVNNMFLTHLSLKNTGISQDKWLDNPTGSLVEGFVEACQKGSFEELSKEVSPDFERSVDLLLEAGEFKKVGTKYLLNSNVIMAARSLDGPVTLESDINIRNGNLIYVHELGDTISSVVQNEQTKFAFGKNKPWTDADRQMRRELYEKMIVVSDEDRNLNAMLGIPETDILGGIVGPGIDVNEYIHSHKPDYDTIIDRANVLADKVERANRDHLTRDDIIESNMSAYSKILFAHPEDIELPGYQKMAEEAMKGPELLSEDASPKLKAQITALSEKTRAFFDPAASLDAVDAAVEDAQKNVYRGSREYDDAGAALKDVKTAYADLMYNSQGDAEMTKEKIAELRAKIDTADKAIDAYFGRKTRQGLYGENKKEEPSPKTQKRINIMEKAKGNLITYLVRLDEIEKKGNIEAERQAERDKIRNVQKSEAEMIEQTANQYKESFEKTDNTMEKYVSKCALAAHGVLRTLAEGKGPDLLDEAQMEVVKKGLASMMLYEIMQTPEGDKLRNQVPKNMYTYNNELKNFMSQEAFGKVMPISMTRQELKSALKDRTYIQNLQEKFNKEVEREVKRDYKAQLAKETQANVNRDVQRGRSNAIQKNPASRGRSNTVYEKNTKPEGPKTEAGHGMGGPK